MRRFVDVHVHPPAESVEDEAFAGYLADVDLPFGPATMEALADHYRSRNGLALVHAFDARTVTGATALTNRRLAELVADHRDAVVGLGSVDPHRGAAAVTAAHDVERMGLRGLFLHPAGQQFAPSARRFAPLWEMAEDLGLPVMVHCGVTVLGAGHPGGGGVRLRFSDPMEVDEVAARHPALQIVMAGISPPWEEAAIAVATHKANVHLALSGRCPGGFGNRFREAISGPLVARTMCGTGFPFVDTDSWLRDWDSLGFDDPVDRAVLCGNAEALFRL